MYYLRTKSAVDAIKFTLDKKKKKEPVAVVKADDAIVVQQQVIAEQTAVKFAQQSNEVEPMSSDEMKTLIDQAKAGQGDDCLMCGS
jgi:ribonucleoside-diphosphate reductase alpha chain